MENMDFLWMNLRSLPYFRAILRAMESKAYQQFSLQRPILDLGCGDGHFAKMTFKDGLDVGIDPWKGPVYKAKNANGHKTIVLGSGECLPFPPQYFNTIISNSVLEHIPEIDVVLAELSRVSRKDTIFIFCVPNHNFLSNLSISNFLDRISMNKLADGYRAFFNRISRHYHCDPPEIWRERLESHGFRIEKWWHYFSPEAFRVLEWGHYLGLPSLVSHYLFHKWILVPEKWNLWLIERALRPYYEEYPEQGNGSYTFYVARRVYK